MDVDIRDNLRMAIKEKGYIQAAIAKKANMPASKLSQVLNKGRKLEANELFDICEAMDITPSDLRNYHIASTGKK